MDSDTNTLEVGASLPPRENLVRGIRPGVELRDAEDGSMPTLHGRFAVFNEWTEINSAWEGRFLERIHPGAFKKTISENRAGMRVLFDHGHDPNIGNKPLGPIADLREAPDGAYYEVPLLDTEYVRELLPGLKAGLYGASFRFKVMREDFDKQPERSDHNPERLPERTITEARVMEFGPVTFPAYDGATAAVRSLTDDWVRAELFGDQERLQEFLRGLVPPIFTGKVNVKAVRYADEGNFANTGNTLFAPAPPTPPVTGTSDMARRDNPRKFNTDKEWSAWIESI